MKRTTTLIGSFVIALAFVATASAQQGAADGEVAAQKGGEDLKQEIAELRAEIAALRKELKGVNAALKQAVATMRSGAKGGQKKRPAMELLGKTAPEFAFTTIDGAKTTVGGKRDKPQVVFCYASWCGFCKKSLPWMETVHKKYADKGVEVLAMNLDQRGEGGRSRTEEQSLTHFKGMNLTLPMTMTTAGNDTSKIGTAYKARSFPTLFVLGADGKVASVHIGAKAGLADTIGKELDALLAGKPLPK